MIHLVHPMVYAGTTLGREGDPKAVRKLGLPSFEMVTDTRAIQLNGKVAGRVVVGRKREVDPEGLPFLLS